ncbi:MAG: NAD(P)H-dependent oxidoreductase [Thermoleophilia bacterium]|nr:NAD(P)H-dependent oxidoreductase [Thermoleophilia bacterium]
MPLLQVIIASTRPGRQGPAIAEWFAQRARDHGGFDVEVVDLKEFALPNYDEPQHPASGVYVHDHTKAWAVSVARADAYAFVIPEYNHFVPAALINAFTFVNREWSYKPAGIVSYGGVSAGLRSASATKEALAPLKVVPLYEAVSLPFFQQFINDEGVVEPNEIMLESSTAMLDELVRWEVALRTLRSDS